MGSQNDKNKLIKNMITLVMDMCKRVKSVDCRRQNIRQCFLCIHQIHSEFFDK